MSYENTKPKQTIKEASATKQLKEKVLELLKEVPLVTYACQKLNIPKSTFYKWKDIDLKFKEDVDLAINLGRSTVNDMAISQLMKKINDGETVAIIFWLKHNSPMFDKKITLEIENKNEGYTKEELGVIVKSLKTIGYEYVVNENKKLTEKFKELLKENSEGYDDYNLGNSLKQNDEEDKMVKYSPKPEKTIPQKPEEPKLKYGIKRNGVNIQEYLSKKEAEKKQKLREEKRNKKVDYKSIIDKMGG
jgi:ACT domain-containing protein